MKGIFSGLRDMHSIGITHRDIKYSNILVDNNRFPVLEVKICDLGSAKKLASDPNDISTQNLNYIGTRPYNAPELLAGDIFYDEKIDIWSAGIVFLNLVLVGFLGSHNMFMVDNTAKLCQVIMELIGRPS